MGEFQNNPELQALFFEEVGERLQRADELLPKIQSGEVIKDNLHAVRIEVHAIKSQAAMMEYPSMAFLAHVLEDIFDYAENDFLKLDKSVLDEVVGSVADLKKSLESVKAGGPEVDVSSHSEKLKELTGVQTEGLGPSPRDEQGRPVLKKGS